MKDTTPEKEECTCLIARNFHICGIENEVTPQTTPDTAPNPAFGIDIQQNNKQSGKNTPDTEWGEVVKQALAEFKQLRRNDFERPTNAEGIVEILDPDEWFRTLISQLLTSRDTYWKERVRKEFGDFAHEHYLGCHADEVGKWHYSYDTEVVYLVDKYLEKITNKDNLK